MAQLASSHFGFMTLALSNSKLQLVDESPSSNYPSSEYKLRLIAFLYRCAKTRCLVPLSLHLKEVTISNQFSIRHSTGKHLPGYPPDSTRQTRVPAYIIPMGSTTRGY